MDQIISFFSSFLSIYDLRGFNGLLRQALSILWIIGVMVVLGTPVALQLYERDKKVFIRRVMYVALAILAISTLGLIYFQSAPTGRWGSDWLAEQDTAVLDVCKLDSPSGDPTQNVTFRARIHWRNPPMAKIETYHVAAINPNDELWPQVVSSRLIAGEDTIADFVVSRRSMFPTKFSVIGLDEPREIMRQNACQNASTCFLQMPQNGIYRISNQFQFDKFDQFVPKCP
ncbi:hypothetical protein [Sphingobium sp. MK2]|uniref:hypothetical protein n=1 Tax=Sphingobium sp. MK2 TaxID=3116540 RepID=UPI0032E35CB0